MYQLLEKAIVLTHSDIAVPNLGLLILGIVLALIGVILPKVIPEGNRAWLAIFWIGIIIIVIWFILLALSFCC